jgi:hypothetical protein
MNKNGQIGLIPSDFVRRLKLVNIISNFQKDFILILRLCISFSLE